MCGRYVSPDEAAMERAWGFTHAPNPFPAIYNAAPTMQLSVVRRTAEGPELCGMQWGLIPAWWSREQRPHSTINARIEDAATKPMWRTAIKRTRCLVPSLGWYEWKKPETTRQTKQPYFIHLPNRELFHFAGLWSSWTPKGGETILSFAILTRDAAPGIAHIHDRMPVVLPRDAYEAWLDPTAEDGRAAAATAAGAAVTNLAAHPVSTYVNSPRNQGEECTRKV